MSSSEGCCGSVCRCLASIPCTVLCIFIAFTAAVLACGGSLVVAFFRTRIVLGMTDTWPYFMYVCLGIGIGLLVLGVVFLTVSTVSGRCANPQVLVSRNRTRCVRATNVLVMVLMMILQLAWLLITVAVTAIVLCLVLVDRHGWKALDAGPMKCVNLGHYGLHKLHKPVICGDELSKFLIDLKKQDLLICYGISAISSVILVVTLSLFLINAAANYARLGKKAKSAGAARPTTNDVASGHVIGSYYDGRGAATETTM